MSRKILNFQQKKMLSREPMHHAQVIIARELLYSTFIIKFTISDKVHNSLINDIINIIKIYLFVDGCKGDNVGCSREQVLYFNYRVEQTIIFMSYYPG